MSRGPAHLRCSGSGSSLRPAQSSASPRRCRRTAAEMRQPGAPAARTAPPRRRKAP
jgi:hypothetical protein